MVRPGLLRLLTAFVVSLPASSIPARANDLPAARIKDLLAASNQQSRWKDSLFAALDATLNERYAEAEEHLKGAIVEAEGLGTGRPELAGTIECLAEVYLVQEKWKEAEPLLARALTLKEKALGAKHLAIAGTLNRLAACKSSLDQFVAADALYKRALAIEEELLGPENLEVVSTLEGVATLHFRQALASSLAGFGSMLKEGLPSLEALAALQQDRERAQQAADSHFQEAAQLLERVLRIREKVLGPDHPEVVKTLDNLIELHGFAQRPDRAEPLLRSKLAIMEKVHGPEHREVAAVLTALGENCIEQMKFREAEPPLRRALAIQEKDAGGNPDLVREQREATMPLLQKAVRSAAIMENPELGPTEEDLKYLRYHLPYIQATDLTGLLKLQVLHFGSGDIDDEGLSRLKGLVNLKWLIFFNNDNITDVGLARLEGLPSLEELELSSTRITGRGLEHLKRMPALKKLELNAASIGDADLVHFQDFPNLEFLSLAGTNVTDAGIIHLKKLTRLVSLNLSATKVTAAGMKELRDALPELSIDHAPKLPDVEDGAPSPR